MSLVGINLKWKLFFFYFSSPIPYLVKFWFSVYGPKYCQPIKLQDSLKCDISKKKWMMNFYHGIHIKIKVVYKLMLSFWVCVTTHGQCIQNKCSYVCTTSRKSWGIKLIFCLQISKNVFYKLIVSILMFLARHAQVTQNNKFAISLQYVKKEVSDEVDCLDADKHERLLQVDTMILMGIVKHSQISQNSTSLQCLFNIWKKKLYEVDF